MSASITTGRWATVAVWTMVFTTTVLLSIALIQFNRQSMANEELIRSARTLLIRAEEQRDELLRQSEFIICILRIESPDLEERRAGINRCIDIFGGG